MTIRAGPGGAVVAALPHSAVARLARAHPHVYANVAVGLARRLRPALPARLWDRCGAEWCALKAGECLTSSRTGMSHAGRHPEGVYAWWRPGACVWGVVLAGSEGGGAGSVGDRATTTHILATTSATWMHSERIRGRATKKKASSERREVPRSRRGGGRGHRAPRGGRASRG